MANCMTAHNITHTCIMPRIPTTSAPSLPVHLLIPTNHKPCLPSLMFPTCRIQPFITFHFISGSKDKDVVKEFICHFDDYIFVANTEWLIDRPTVHIRHLNSRN